MAIEWNRPVVTHDGRHGLVLPDDTWNPKKRVAIQRSGHRFAALTDGREVTTWLYNLDGTIDGDRSGDWSLRNIAA